ncbi:Nematode resistance protein-like HSPRO2 [Bienertia sinuspersici]
MVDYDCNSKFVHFTPTLSQKNPKITPKRTLSTPLTSPIPVSTGDLSPASETSCTAYETYLRLPELRKLWSSKQFPGWENEPYVNRRQWNRRLESLARDQVELISFLCEDDATRGGAPTVDFSSGEVSSFLPRLATWQVSEQISAKIVDAIESAMRGCGYSLGLGEPNSGRKPILDYDAVCRPSELHALSKGALNYIQNPENQILFTIHQIFESWIFSAKQLLFRVGDRIKREEFSRAADDCWILERVWKILEGISNLHLLMDPDDFLHLKTQLKMKTTSDSDSETFCFRSRGLMEITKQSKDLRHKVPEILDVEVDPMGGPIVQESAMELYREKRSFEKIHLLQAFQGVESAVKGFFYNYKQLLVIMVGSLEAKANFAVVGSFESSDLLAQIFLEPTYYPSLDGAKTLLVIFGSMIRQW